MSEAIIAKRFQSKDYTYYPPYNIPNDTIITSNSTYICPFTAYYQVQCLGGGGAGGRRTEGRCLLDQSKWGIEPGSEVDPPDGYIASPVAGSIVLSGGPDCHVGGGGGGSGYISSATILLNQGQQVPVTIGRGGQGDTDYIGNSGGTTSFGTYVAANGGEGGRSYAGHWNDELELSDFTLDYERWSGGPSNWLVGAYYRLRHGPDGGRGGNRGYDGSVFYDNGEPIGGNGSRSVAKGGIIYLDRNNSMVTWTSEGTQTAYGRGGNGDHPDDRYTPAEDGNAGMVIIKFHHLVE